MELSEQDVSRVDRCANGMFIKVFNKKRMI